MAEILVDLKERIGGRFMIASCSSEEIVLVNDVCPFGRAAVGRPSLCMMTSNVFGIVAAEGLGYAQVELSRTIAEGHGHCRVRVKLNNDGVSPDSVEYFPDSSNAG